VPLPRSGIAIPPLFEAGEAKAKADISDSVRAVKNGTADATTYPCDQRADGLNLIDASRRTVAFVMFQALSDA
jgi:hypothetical protein